jgi:hypothetical protein
MMKLHEAIYDYCFLARVSNSRSQSLCNSSFALIPAQN